MNPEIVEISSRKKGKDISNLRNVAQDLAFARAFRNYLSNGHVDTTLGTCKASGPFTSLSLQIFTRKLEE
jgi:hypothetical protein